MKLPTLYKLDAKNSVREWTISVEKHGDAAIIRTLAGLKGGALTESLVNIRKGKNLGKSNATTPFTQAQAEAKATQMVSDAISAGNVNTTWKYGTGKSSAARSAVGIVTSTTRTSVTGPPSAPRAPA